MSEKRQFLGLEMKQIPYVGWDDDKKTSWAVCLENEIIFHRRMDFAKHITRFFGETRSAENLDTLLNMPSDSHFNLNKAGQLCFAIWYSDFYTKNSKEPEIKSEVFGPASVASCTKHFVANRFSNQ